MKLKSLLKTMAGNVEVYDRVGHKSYTIDYLLTENVIDYGTWAEISCPLYLPDEIKERTVKVIAPYDDKKLWVSV